MYPTYRNRQRAVKIKATQTAAPLYPTLVKAVTAAATAALLSACDEPAPQRPPGLRPAPAPVDDSRRADILPESYTAGIFVSPERCDVRPAPAPPPYEPNIESVLELADTPLDNPSTTQNID